MYINKEELIIITDSQIKNLEQHERTGEYEYKFLKRVKSDLVRSRRVEIDEIIHILSKELNNYGRLIRNKLKNGEDARELVLQ